MIEGKDIKVIEQRAKEIADLIEEKYQEIRELCPQVGIALAKNILASKNK